MSMLLTIAQPTKAEFGGSRFTHDFSPRIPLAKSRLSPKPRGVSPVSSLRASVKPEDNRMSTPHRGLPPPSAMISDVGRPPPPLTQMPGAMPPPPPQWQGQEDSMRHYLAAKAEEDKRRQEEEKTRQESFRLEQRKIEVQILTESSRMGIPPAMIPMIYAGIGASNLANVSYDYLREYFEQLRTSQHNLQQQSSPELRRETRLIGQGSQQGYIPQPQAQQVVPSQHTEHAHQPPPLNTTFSAYQGPPNRPPPMSTPRSATHTQLPRLTTNEMYINQPPQQGPGSAHPLQQSQTIQQDQPASSPNIYFHHWVPPTESKANLPQTPASRGEPLSAHPVSHLSESDYKESPRKRKAQGPHERAPPPSSAPMHTSPAFSAASSTGSARRSGHMRSRSNTSARESESRPDSRRDPDPPRSSQPESAPTSEEQPPSRDAKPPYESGRSSTGAPRENRAERPGSGGPR